MLGFYMKNKKLKYCILTNESLKYFKRESIDYAGFYQWLNVFDGQILEAVDVLPELKDGDFDIIHIRLIGVNLNLIDTVRRKIGKDSKTKMFFFTS